MLNRAQAGVSRPVDRGNPVRKSRTTEIGIWSRLRVCNWSKELFALSLCCIVPPGIPFTGLVLVNWMFVFMSMSTRRMTPWRTTSPSSSVISFETQPMFSIRCYSPINACILMLSMPMPYRSVPLPLLFYSPIAIQSFLYASRPSV